MRIDPALIPGFDPQPGLTPGAPPSQSFAQLLDGDMPPERAFGFVEFGMFGREGQAGGGAQEPVAAQLSAEPSLALLPVESLADPAATVPFDPPAALPGDPAAARPG